MGSWAKLGLLVGLRLDYLRSGLKLFLQSFNRCLRFSLVLGELLLDLLENGLHVLLQFGH